MLEVSLHFVVLAALRALADQGERKAGDVARAIAQYGIDPAKPDPATV